MVEEVSEPVSTEKEPAPRSRVDIVNEVLTKYPIEQYLDWYKTNYPDVYAGYLFAKAMYLKPVAPQTVEQKVKWSLKTILILFAILGVTIVIVYFVLLWLFSQAGSMFG